MKYFYIVLSAILVVLLGISAPRSAAQPVSCSSGYIDNPQNRKLCAVLASMYGIPNLPNLDTYSEEVRPNAAYGPMGYKNRLFASDFDSLVDRGTKRQDVDHVFLRFGRRR